MREIVAEQRTQEWFAARVGKVTGTTLERAINPKKQVTFMYEMIAGMMTEPMGSDLNVPAVIRGREMEPYAIAQARKDLGIEFEPVGFCVSNLIPGFGLSPDNVLYHDGKIIGGIEIKAPNTATHLRYIDADVVPKDYIWQVQAPFIASDDVEFWYFLSYDDRCYERQTFYKKVLREDVKDIEKTRETLIEFIGMVNKKHGELTF